jgi:hypothetical protein
MILLFLHLCTISDNAQYTVTYCYSYVFQDWENTEDGSWLREYPVTLIQFLVFLYRNVAPFSVVCTGQEFLENLVAILFPKRRRLAKSQEVCKVDSCL